MTRSLTYRPAAAQLSSFLPVTSFLVSPRWTTSDPRRHLMKLFFFASFVLMSALGGFGQASQTENDFESRKNTYAVERFTEGEDATSGYDYLFYKNGAQIVKIRSIWSASYSKELRIEDFYFNGDQLLLFRKFTAPSRLLKSLKKRDKGLLTSTEEFHFANGKLARWVVSGKA